MSTDIEHASLRQEIIESGSHAINAANIVVPVTGAAIFAAFQFRTPYIALLPLFLLYYGHNIAFNNSQTIARTSVYLRLIEKERYEDLLNHLREAILSNENEMRKKRWLPLRWLSPHSVLWEEWISPILQTMFIWLGFICILCFGLIAWLMAITPNQTTGTPPDLILPLSANAIICAVVFLIWTVVALRLRRISHPFYGPGNMTRQFEKAWMEVIDSAVQD